MDFVDLFIVTFKLIAYVIGIGCFAPIIIMKNKRFFASSGVHLYIAISAHGCCFIAHAVTDVGIYEVIISHDFFVGYLNWGCLCSYRVIQGFRIGKFDLALIAF